jgi:uncharacterized membrane protein YqjE
MSYTESSPPLATPGSVPRVVVEALMHRGELASIELREARLHAAKTAVAAVFSGALLLLGGFAGTFALAAAVWNRGDRGLILGLVTLAYLAASAALGLVAARRLKAWQPFSETFRQFREDCSCLHDALASGSR